MGAVRLNGDQTERLMVIARSNAVERYEHWDWRLRDLGLVAIGQIPPAVEAGKRKWIAETWLRVRKMVNGGGAPSLAKIREVEGLLNQMNHTAYRLDKKWSTLTEAGKKLAADGRSVILPRDLRVEKDV